MPPDTTRDPADDQEIALAAAAYVPLLSSDGGTSTITLVRQIRVAGRHVLTTAVWERVFDSHVEALDYRGWLMSDPAPLVGWGRTAAILGQGALTAILDARWQAELESRRRKRERDEERTREAEEIWLLQEEVGRTERPAIVMRKGGKSGEKFLTIKLDEKWERDRIYDWAQWQTEHYGEWKAHRDEHGEAALERLIMTGMVRTENTVRKAGLGSGGRRPLRFWRGEPK